MAVLGIASPVFAQASDQPAPAVDEPKAPPAEMAPPAQAPPSEPAPSAQADYVVLEGDTLARIAEKLTGDESNWQAIAQENGIDDPTRLQVGMRLRIPASLRST
ncbi:MAG TPA: LysM domain-containing protein [Myxococcota bacterium]